jgi:hypothetical protein
MFNIIGEKMEGKAELVKKEEVVWQFKIERPGITFNCEVVEDYILNEFYIRIKELNTFAHPRRTNDNIPYLRFHTCVEFQGKCASGIYISEEVYNKLLELKEKFEEKLKKLKEELKKLQEDEYNNWLKKTEPFDSDLLCSQGCDTGNFYVVGIENEKIKDFTNKALNKYLDGLIFEDWIPDYWLPNTHAKFELNELLKQGKAKKIDNDRFTLSKDIANEIVNLLKQEIQKQQEEEEKKVQELKERIKKERKVLIAQYATPCCDPNEQCDVDVHDIYAFADEKEAKEFAKSEKGEIYYNEKLEAWMVETWYHTW